jgi:chorismate lyase / 3-hydroxybenzoate synthase
LSAQHLTDPALTLASQYAADPAKRTPRLRMEYFPQDDPTLRSDGILAGVCFGQRCIEPPGLPLCVNVQMPSLLPGSAPVEAWFARGKVLAGQQEHVRFACDDHYLFAVVERDEREFRGIELAAEAVYAEIRRFQRGSGYPYLLRLWNFLDHVNQGGGDLERYRQFCVGRGRGLGDMPAECYPAASALGRQQTTHKLQTVWIAAREPGTPLENPRQMSAYRYPRIYGPTSPSFSRATLNLDGTLIVSGTASIVGHVSTHPGDPLAQLDETLKNLSALTAHAAGYDGKLHEAGLSHLFRVYVRHPEHAAPIAEHLQRALPGSKAIFLAADICRRELLLEIEALIQPALPDSPAALSAAP